MLVDGSEGERLDGLRRGQPVEPVFEDRVDVAVGANADGQGPGTGGLEPGGAIAAAEAEQPQAGAVALLGTCRSCGSSRSYLPTKDNVRLVAARGMTAVS
jgi:hypothetical protein